ncbi:hypothetical protein DRQ09_05120 [candidate division KSB1 bacterium]|nr:MAG: hypothetical protein DRQ09_05120 [candidate division KSB1 bacterium]
MKKFLVIIFINFFLIFFIANDSYLQERTRKGGESLFGDVKAYKIGDVITIIISENSQASNVSNTQTNKQNQLSVQSNFGKLLGELTGRLAGKISSNTQNRFRGSGQTSSQGKLITTISARIVEITENGNFLIRGSKEIETNGEKVTTVVSGVIRREDISPDNTIYSTQIADAHIYHDGKGVVKQGNRPGLFTRIINWIF